ncbi:unnamed protein product, partial [Mesorhabditis spiculigera]
MRPSYGPFHIACILIETISVSLYIRALIGIARSKNNVFQDSPFFTTFLSIGVADVGSIFVNAALRHLTVYKVGPAETWETVYRIVYLLSALFFYCHFLGHSILALNRFTSVVLPGSHKEFWECNTYRLIFGKWMLAVVLILHRLTARLSFAKRDDGYFIVTGYLPSRTHLLAHMVSGTTCGVVSFVSLFLSVATIVKLYHSYNQVSMSQSTIERNLIIYTVLTFISCLAMDWQQFARVAAVLRTDEKQIVWVNEQYFWINDILAAKWADSLPPHRTASANLATVTNIHSKRSQWNVNTAMFNNPWAVDRPQLESRAERLFSQATVYYRRYPE